MRTQPWPFDSTRSVGQYTYKTRGQPELCTPHSQTPSPTKQTRHSSSSEETQNSEEKNPKKQHIKPWSAQSWSTRSSHRKNNTHSYNIPSCRTQYRWEPDVLAKNSFGTLCRNIRFCKRGSAETSVSAIVEFGQCAETSVSAILCRNILCRNIRPDFRIIYDFGIICITCVLFALLVIPLRVMYNVY